MRLQSGSGGGFRRVIRKGERKMARASFPPVDDVRRAARSFLDAAMPRLFNEPRHIVY